jgi:hypothetical protein
MSDTKTPPMPMILPDPPPRVVTRQPLCPNCGSNRTASFSAGARVLAFGILAAGSVGKSWQCYGCKYKW